MKIGVVSDTHIPDRAKTMPQEMLDAFKTVDMVIHVGDLVDINILKKIKYACPDVRAVWGNMDNEKTKSELPEKAIIKIGKYKIGMIHGWGSGVNSHLINIAKEVFKKDTIDIIIFGHSHTPYNETKDGILFFNPGSPTDTVFAPYNSYGIIEINDKIEAKIIRI